MSKTVVRAGLLAALAVVLAWACADLDVPNLTEADRERTLASPDDAVQLVAGSLKDWFQGVYSRPGTGLFMSQASFQHSSPWACATEVYSRIPILPAGKEWVEDPTMRDGVFRQKYPDEDFKTEKRLKAQVLYKHTDKHPAQVEKINETVNVGKKVRNVWCGAITERRKLEKLERIDKLMTAVKQARQRANEATVVKVTVGGALLDYING